MIFAHARYLSTAEQRILVVQWRTHGDSSARERLIIGLIPSVRLRVQYFAGKKPLDSELRDDLISEGITGLVYGLDKYDVSRLADTAPWGYVENWVDLRIREAMVRLIPAVSFRNYMAWWRTGSERKLEGGEAFDGARDDEDNLLARTLASDHLDPETALVEAEKPSEAWTTLRELVPHLPDEEWELFGLRVLHRLTPTDCETRYRRTWPYWRAADVERVCRRVLSDLLAAVGADASAAAAMPKLRKLFSEEDAPDAPPPPAPTSTREWSLSPSPPAEPKPSKKRR